MPISKTKACNSAIRPPRKRQTSQYACEAAERRPQQARAVGGEFALAPDPHREEPDGGDDDAEGEPDAPALACPGPGGLRVVVSRRTPAFTCKAAGLETWKRLE